MSPPISLDKTTRTARAGARSAQLNEREFAVIACLVEASGATVAHADLLARAFRPNTAQQNLRVTISTLRRKLEPDPEMPVLILSEPGVGYRLGGYSE